MADGQTGVVAGRVVDAESGRPLASAQISIAGTGRGGLSRANGQYAVSNVPAATQTVRVEIIGYAPQEQTVTVSSGQTVTVDFQLLQDAINLSGFVVTGVGQETQRRQLATSVDVISSEQISEIPVTSVDQLLKGRVAGATVNAQSAQPGTSSLVNFRGASSVFGSQTPVIYVDGIRVDNSQSTAAGTGGEQSSALADLLTSDIDRIEITKGGAASTLYGSDAATGVIQIFTKRGTPGETRVTFRSEYGWDQPELKYMFDTPMSFPGLVESGETSPTFMEDNYWRTGFALNQYVAVTGGSDVISYNVSGRIQNEEGVQPKNESTIYAARGGLRASVANNLTVNFSGNYTRSQFQRLFNGEAIADPLTAFEIGDALFFSRTETLEEALDVFLLPDIDEYVDRFLISGGFDWSFRPDWFARLTTGIDHRSNQQRAFQPIGFTPGQRSGALVRYDRGRTTFTVDAATGYSWEASGGDMANDITVGVQGYREDLTIISSRGSVFFLPGAPDFDQAAEVSSFEINEEAFTGGLYIDESLDLWDRLTINAGVRFDGSTAFGDEVSVETYPKAGLSYLISNEDFFPTGSILNELKLRGAYGETGKPPTPFDKDASFSAVAFRDEPAPRFDNPGNEDLRPERTRTVEAGLDAALWSGRVGVDFTYFDATTTDALFFVPEQPVTGKGTQLRNVGTISNKGVELALSVQLVNQENLAWTVGGTYQTVDNKVTDMGGASPFNVEPQKRVCGPPVDCDPRTEGLEELPVGAWYVTTPVDTNGDGLNDEVELRYTGGQPMPTSSGSLNTTLRLGTRWTISSLADFAYGHEVMDYGSAYATFNGIYRREEIEGVAFPMVHDLDGTELGPYFQSAARSAFIYDGDWFKWREVFVRYQMPDALAQALRSDRGSLYFSGRNLWIWSRNQLIDPELNGLSGDGLELGGETSVTASPPRRFRFGVELVF